MSLGVNAYQHINITVGAKIITQDRAKQGKFVNALVFAEFSDFLAWKTKLVPWHG